MSIANPIGPTDPRTRLRSVDAVRGFALFGVLLVNMYNFGAYYPEWTSLIDRMSLTAMHSVFETKSWRLFAILFGFGFALQMLKAEVQAGGLWFYFRRLMILFIIGMVHALFYEGDILMQYAMLGVILVAFRKVPKRVLLVLTVVLLAVMPVGNVIVSLSENEPVAEAVMQSQEIPSLAERREGIRKAMDEAKVARESAERKSAEYDGKLKLLDSRVEEIYRELREEGEGEKERIIAEAERGAEKIKEQARVSAEQEIKKANEYIKREVARLAVGMAGEVLKREVKPSDQERLIDESLKTISLQ